MYAAGGPAALFYKCEKVSFRDYNSATNGNGPAHVERQLVCGRRPCRPVSGCGFLDRSARRFQTRHLYQDDGHGPDAVRGGTDYLKREETGPRPFGRQTLLGGFDIMMCCHRVRNGRLMLVTWLVALALVPAATVMAQPATSPGAGAPAAATQPPATQPPATQPPPPPTTQPPTTQPPTTQPPAESPVVSPPVTVEAIQQRLKDVENLSELDDEAKAKLRELYQKALQDLTEAQGYLARSNSFAKMAESVEEQLKTVNFQLSAAPNNVTIDVPPDATVQKLVQLAEEANAEVLAAQRRKNELEAEPGRRQQRRVELPKIQQEVRRKEQELAEQLTTVTAAGPMGEAQKTRIQAQQIAVAREKELYEKELNAYVATAELLPLERELANRQLSLAEKRLAKWRELVDVRRRTEASEKAEAARLENAMASPALQPLAARNQALAERSQQLVIKIQEITGELDDTEKLFTKIEGQFKSTKSKVEQVGLTNAIGLLLRQQNAHLPDVSKYRVNSQQHIQEIRATQLELIELEEERGSLFDIDRTEAIISELAASDTGFLPLELEGAVTDLLEKQKEHFRTLLQNENTYFGRLVDLENAEAQLIKIVAEYDNYIGERILWVRSSGTITLGDIRRSGGALAWFLDREHWAQVAKQSRTDIRSHMFFYIAALLSFGLLLAFQQHLRRLISHLGEQASKGNCESYAVTVIALLWTLIVAAVWPLLLWTVAWRLTSVSGATEFSKFLGVGLAVSAVFYFSLEFLRQVCRHRGLAHAHFEWPHGVRSSLRRNLRWFMLATLPLVFVAAVFYTDASSRWYDSLPRLVLITVLVLTAILAHTVLRPNGQLFRAYSVASVDSRFYRLRYVWYALVMSLPISLALLAVFGYQYTAHRLTVRSATVDLVAAVPADRLGHGSAVALPDAPQAGHRHRQRTAGGVAEPGCRQSQPVGRHHHK